VSPFSATTVASVDEPVTENGDYSPNGGDKLSPFPVSPFSATTVASVDEPVTENGDYSILYIA